MQSIELFEFVRNLCLYFERKMPTNETLEQWYPEVEYIPSESLDWIAKKFKSLDTWPRNLPAHLKSFWYQWLDAHPEKQWKEELGCDGCLHGYIQVGYFIKELGGWYNRTFRCDQCQPKYPKEMAMSNVDALLEAGYHQPLGYLSSFRYADRLPKGGSEVISIHRKVDPESVDQIVEKLAGDMDFPF